MPAAADRVRDIVGARVVTRQWLLQAGVSSRTLSRAVALGLVRRVGPGLYGPSGDVDPLTLAVRTTGGVVAGPSAALLHGFDLVVPPGVHHLAVPRRSHRRPPEGCRVRRVDVPAGERVVLSGLPVTSPVRTVLDCARWLPVAEAVVVGDAALRQRAVLPNAVASAVAGLPRSRVTARVRRVADLLDGLSGSVLESLARVLFDEAGLPEPVLQMPVQEESGVIARVDMAWPEARLVVELDGFAYHSQRRDVRRDRFRSNGLTLLGWRVLRFGWEDVVGRPEVVVALVRAALAAGPR
jgi:predicted transcriptional regulator of viral defense system